MAKIIVTANEDFFDRANNISRTAGSEFLLKSDYAATLGNLVTANDVQPEKKTKRKKQLKSNPC